MLKKLGHESKGGFLLTFDLDRLVMVVNSFQTIKYEPYPYSCVIDCI